MTNGRTPPLASNPLELVLGTIRPEPKKDTVTATAKAEPAASDTPRGLQSPAALPTRGLHATPARELREVRRVEPLPTLKPGVAVEPSDSDISEVAPATSPAQASENAPRRAADASTSEAASAGIPDDELEVEEPSKARAPRRTRPAIVETASLRHRVGTLKAPYERRDGIKVRQWAVTLPVDVIRRMNHRAIDLGVRPADVVLLALEHYLEESRSSRR